MGRDVGDVGHASCAQACTEAPPAEGARRALRRGHGHRPRHRLGASGGGAAPGRHSRLGGGASDGLARLLQLRGGRRALRAAKPNGLSKRVPVGPHDSRARSR